MSRFENRGFTSNASLVFFEDECKIVAIVDPEISRLARSLIPKHFDAKPQRHHPHITVVRDEIIPNISAWQKCASGNISFRYSSRIEYNETYFWLCCWSQDLCDLRESLGLPSSSILTRPPDGKECFHITISNRKHLAGT